LNRPLGRGGGEGKKKKKKKKKSPFSDGTGESEGKKGGKRKEEKGGREKGKRKGPMGAFFTLNFNHFFPRIALKPRRKKGRKEERGKGKGGEGGRILLRARGDLIAPLFLKSDSKRS